MIVRPPGEDVLGGPVQGLKTLATVVCPPGKERKATSWLRLARLGNGWASAPAINEEEQQVPNPDLRIVTLIGMHPTGKPVPPSPLTKRSAAKTLPVWEALTYAETEMAHRFIVDCRPGERLTDEVFLIRSKDLRTTTQGGLYIHAVLQDRSGQIVARMWQATENIFKQFPEAGFLRFTGRVENYKGNPQFIIDGIGLVEPDSYDIADYVAATEKNIDEMWTRLVEIVGGITDSDLSALVQEFLDDETLMVSFRKAPAAAVMHHAYIGGLLEHTLNLLEVAVRILPLYPRLSSDLMLAGLFLHDIGKAAELSYETSIGYTDNGQLVGHIVIAAGWVREKASAIADRTGKPFPQELLWALQHIVLSHHGQYEFGSPKLPALPEAAAIHYLDNLDAKTNMFLSEIDNDRDPAGKWTRFVPALQTKVYKPDILGDRSQ